MASGEEERFGEHGVMRTVWSAVVGALAGDGEALDLADWIWQIGSGVAQSERLELGWCNQRDWIWGSAIREIGSGVVQSERLELGWGNQRDWIWGGAIREIGSGVVQSERLELGWCNQRDWIWGGAIKEAIREVIRCNQRGN